MAIWFTSDNHFYHRNIIKYCNRPFADLDEMHKAMIDNWNELVQPNDDVYVLGDFTFDTSKLKDILDQLAGNKYLTPGNHDTCHPMRSKHRKEARKYEDSGFINVLGEHHYLEHYEVPELKDKLIHLNHFPYRDLSGDDPRYPELRPIRDEYENDKVVALLHGHQHNSMPTIQGNCINVGVDNWNFKPVSIAQILEIVFPKVANV